MLKNLTLLDVLRIMFAYRNIYMKEDQFSYKKE